MAGLCERLQRTLRRPVASLSADVRDLQTLPERTIPGQFTPSVKAMKRKRNRAKPTTTLHDRPIGFAQFARHRAKNSPSDEREKLLRQARQAERAAELNEALSLEQSK
jgi:hypothetical protein